MSDNYLFIRRYVRYLFTSNANNYLTEKIEKATKI